MTCCADPRRGRGGDGDPARVWVVGAGCRQLIGRGREPGGVRDLVRRSARRWRSWLAAAGNCAAAWVRRWCWPGVGPAPGLVEVVAEPRPWLGGGDGVAEDASNWVGGCGGGTARWGRCLRPAAPPRGGLERSHHGGSGRPARRGRVGAGGVAGEVVPDIRIQPPWCAPASRWSRNSSAPMSWCGWPRNAPSWRRREH